MIQRRDVPALVDLCAEHALFERVAITAPNADRLQLALFSSPTRLRAWVAVDCNERLIGYATATLDYSTWNAREFMHLDCLFVTEAARGRGIGRLLFDAVAGAARGAGIDQLQWQTPQWNASAQRFYERLGAASLTKVRFTLSL